MIEQVYSSMIIFKNTVSDINNRLKLGNKQSEEMQKKYLESNSLINKTTKMLGGLFSTNTNYWCYLCIFIFIIFFFLYFFK